MGIVVANENLRQVLRGATANAHDMLDGTMRTAAGWTTLEDYTCFLSLQYAARLPVEAWLAENAPEDLRPPAQSPLIAQDLAALDAALPDAGETFAGPQTPGADEATMRAQALGTAWVLAGSSLGNRSILAEVQRTARESGCETWPARFLGDPEMIGFWRRLRLELENSTDLEAVDLATHAASLVFEHFIEHAQSSRLHP